MGFMDELLGSVDNMTKEDFKAPIVVKDVLEVESDTTIKGKCPIRTVDKIIIIKSDDSITTPVLRLINTTYTQPCIGPMTNDGLSFGRYELARNDIDEIIIDGVHVICESENDNFTLGKYGIEKMPKITILNNGKLECPEMLGPRVMVQGPDYHEGSTKHSEAVIYAVMKPGVEYEDLISDELKALRGEIMAINPWMAKEINFKTKASFAREAKELLILNHLFNVAPLLSGKYNNYPQHIISGCCVLDLPESCYVGGDMKYEINRWPVLAEKNNISFDIDKDDINGLSKSIIRMHYKADTFEQLSPLQVRYVYELIPLYSLSFTGKTNEECAKEWWEKCMGV